MSNLAVTGSCRPGAEDLSSDLPALKPPSQVQITLGNFDRTTAHLMQDGGTILSLQRE